jgi:hypothetical protein
MSERLASVGGSLSFGPARIAGHAERGLRVVATVPEALRPCSSPGNAGTAGAGHDRVMFGEPPPPRVPAGSE